MSPLPQRTMTDPELGPMRWCATEGEWWPDDTEFWFLPRVGRGHTCKACQRRWDRTCREARAERGRHEASKRERGLCVEGECPVPTPRERCYFCARTVALRGVA